MNKVIVVVGPTGSGKSKVARLIHHKYGIPIINGDSVAIYKELNIGSAKKLDNDETPILLTDIRNVGLNYSVAEFQNDARKIIDNNKASIIVGGSGLYIKACLYQYEFHNEKNNNPNKYDDVLLEQLAEKLLVLDPQIKIDFKNKRRVIRALMLAENNDQRSKKDKKDYSLYESLVIYLDAPREYLEVKIKERLELQLNLGFISEVENLRKMNHFENSIGYKQVNMYLEKLINFDEMKQDIILRSLQYAKKQKTFFKNQFECQVIDITKPDYMERIFLLVEEFLA